MWAASLGRRWGRRAGIVRGGGECLQVTSDDIFAALVRGSEQFRRGDGEVPFRFYVEQALQQADVRAWLPTARDASIARYVARVTRQLGGLRFCLVLNHFQVFDAALWLRLRELLSGLRDRVGVAPGSIDAAAFVGTYRCTPFGVHRDLADSLAVVIAGRKRFRFWPATRFAADGPMENSARYARVRTSATTLLASAGDLVYWPSSIWHVAESTRPYSVSLSIPVLLPHGGRADVYGDLLQRLHDSLRKADGGRAVTSVRGHGARRVAHTGSIVASVRDTLLHTAREQGLADRLRAAWLRAVTGSGFLAVPGPAAVRALGRGWVLRGDPRYPIVWLRSGRGTLLCGANGHAFEIAAAPGHVALIQQLNRGLGVRSDGLRGAARLLLEKLLSLRAITRVEAEAPSRRGTTRGR